MTYRIKVIEYESGRKEYVPQVRKNLWDGWQFLDYNGYESHQPAYLDYIITAKRIIEMHRNRQIKSIKVIKP